MNNFLRYSALLIVGLCGGYFMYPLLHNDNLSDQTPPIAGTSIKSYAQCDLSSAQVEQLINRIAPAVASRLTQLPQNAANQNFVEPKTSVDEEKIADKKLKSDQATAMSQANQMVDQMIANRNVTSYGMGEAVLLLQKSGQSDQAFKLMARVSAAVNSGELTLEQAGMAPANNSSANH